VCFVFVFMVDEFWVLDVACESLESV
jgi:hypothetical protein